MKKRKTFKILAAVAISSGIGFMLLCKKSKPDPLSVEALFGRWQIVDARGKYFGYKEPEITKETFAHIGKTAEFHKRYIIVDGVQRSNLRYTYYTCPCFDDQKSLEGLDLMISEYRIDYWYEEVDKKSDYIIIDPSIDGLYKTPQKWFYSRFTLIGDKLYIGYDSGFLELERIPERPWWQRLYSYWLAVIAPKHDATKIVPKEMWGHWEVVGGNKRFTKSLKEYADYQSTKYDIQTLEKVRGKKFFLHPKYVILEGKQYNNPRYNSEVSYDGKKKYYLDDYNGYSINGSEEQWNYSYQIDSEGNLELMGKYVCRRLPMPSFWQLVKYYCKYLLDIDDSTRGDVFDQKSRK